MEVSEQLGFTDQQLDDTAFWEASSCSCFWDKYILAEKCELFMTQSKRLLLT